MENNEMIEPELTSAPVNAEVVIELTNMSTPPFPSPVSAPEKPGFDKTKLILPGAILVAALMVSGSVLYARLSAGEALVNGTAGTQQAAQTGKPVSINITGAPVMGSTNAPVTLVEFGDFQCPFCRQYFLTNQPSIISDYVNTGKVKFVWMDYSFLGQESTWAAEAARCADDQGKFWPYHDYLYNHQGAEDSGTFTKVKLEGFAATLGLNTSQFNSCLSSDKYASAVAAQTQYGTSLGVSGTPASFVNGVLISGAVPYSQIKAAIDAALGSK